jgi:GT2 family glycosyltransferase
MARDGAKDKPATPKVSVLVVAYQSGPHLAACLAALGAQTFADHEVVLIDNASTDGAPLAAVAAHPEVTFVEAGSNLGFAAGMNLAARHAKGQWLALINPDAFADPATQRVAYVEYLLRRLDERQSFVQEAIRARR